MEWVAHKKIKPNFFFATFSTNRFFNFYLHTLHYNRRDRMIFFPLVIRSILSASCRLYAQIFHRSIPRILFSPSLISGLPMGFSRGNGTILLPVQQSDRSLRMAVLVTGERLVSPCLILFGSGTIRIVEKSGLLPMKVSIYSGQETVPILARMLCHSILLGLFQCVCSCKLLQLLKHKLSPCMYKLDRIRQQSPDY